MSSSSTTRTRFAPSPTGYLHVGTARTALYNYLFARHNGGKLVLRFEDTDESRNVEGGAEAIVDALRWLGLDWDEGYGPGGPHGPYVQTERLERYHVAVNALVARGAAYLCYCSAERLEQLRQSAAARGAPAGYDGHCRDLSAEQVRAYEAEGRLPAVRFRLPGGGETTVNDLIHGPVTFDNATLTDFVIMRPNGIPTYLFAAVYDDVDMGVTHVIRGDDLLPSTPRQIHIFRALGAEPPSFAHLPLLVGADRKKLSKRQGDVALQAFRAKGYLPEALVNYLALLGWAYDDHTEHFTLAELERLFSIERVSRNPAAFDTNKLDALNGWYIRRLTADDFARRALPFVLDAGYPGEHLDLLQRVAPLVAERVVRLDQVPDMVGFLLTDSDELPIDPQDAANMFTDDGRAFLAEAAKTLTSLEHWTAGAIEQALRALAEEHQLKARKAFQPLRLAITGRRVSPPLFESLELLGKDRSLARLDHAAGLIA